MYVCPNCNYSTEELSKFCPVCGTPVVEQPAPQPPVVEEKPVEEPVVFTEPPEEEKPPVAEQPATYQQPYYQAPYNAQPAPQLPSKGKIITGMVLSIAGLVFAGLGLLYTFIGLITGIVAVAFVFAVVFGIFSIPLSIVGFVMSNSSVRAGSTSGMAKAGKILGLIAVIMSGVMLVLGLMSFGFDGYGYSDLFDSGSYYY